MYDKRNIISWIIFTLTLGLTVCCQDSDNGGWGLRGVPAPMVVDAM